MVESPSSHPSGSWRVSRRSYHPTTSPSPSRSRFGDDLLLHKLSPRTVVDMFRSPPPPLKASLDSASATDQAFALRAAIASKKIQEWLDELSEWCWPTVGGSAGFEMPQSKRRRIEGPEYSPSIRAAKGRRKTEPGVNNPLPTDDSEEQDNTIVYRGSLQESQVVEYERRVDEIERGMRDLDLEDIKRHVLHNHIMPLSRPGTPFSDVRSNISTMSISRMDDLTAVITATVIQALPNLSKLTRLMNIWSTRLAVLVSIPGFLSALEEAEVALRSAWNAITLDTKKSHAGETLSKDHFEIMQKVLLPRVSKAGRDLDRLLDILEGVSDTLPEAWLDRMEAVEQGSSEWVATCEQKIRETDWAKILEVSRTSLKVSRTPSMATTLAVSDMEDSIYRGTPDSISSSGGDDHELPAKTETADLPEVPVPSSPLDPGSPIESTEYSVNDSFISEILAYDKDLAVLEEEDEEQTLPNLRRESEVPQEATVIHHLDPFASDGFEREATPEIGRRHGPAAGFVGDNRSPPSSPPVGKKFKESPMKKPKGSPGRNYGVSRPRTPFGPPTDYIEETRPKSKARKPTEENGDAQLQQQICDILESIPAKIRLAPEPASAATLNPPDLPIQRIKQKRMDATTASSRTTSSLSSRAGTPSFTLAPASGRGSSLRPIRVVRGNPEIKLYHLSRSSGETPIKLFIRCVGEHGERVMVRVGGGWADLGEYLKDYASHHRRSGAADAAKVEVRDMDDVRPPSRSMGSSPPSRPGSSMGASSPILPLMIRKTRCSVGASDDLPRTPLTAGNVNAPIANGNSRPSSACCSTRSRSSSWSEEDSSLGLAGPTGKHVEMSDESKAWVESVKEKVRLASGERKFSGSNSSFAEERPVVAPPVGGRSKSAMDSRFGEMGKVGSTKRLFRRGGTIGN